MQCEFYQLHANIHKHGGWAISDNMWTDHQETNWLIFLAKRTIKWLELTTEPCVISYPF